MTHANKISYSGLHGNETLLQQGLPVFTYHKIDRIPRGARWRSLYLSPARFDRQLRELAAAGYTSALLSDPRPAQGNPAKKCVITFDDGYTNVLHYGLKSLRTHAFRAIQFIVAGRIGGENTWDMAEGEVPARLMTAEEIRTWLQAGHEIGSHTVSHPRLTRLKPDELREEIHASKRRLEDAFGVPIRHFCYPYGDYDEQVVAEVERAGYETACTHLVSGTNNAATPRLELRRIEARYPRRNFKLVIAALRRWLGIAPRAT